MPALTTGELDLLRSNFHKAKFYLSVSRPRTLLAGQVNGTFARGERVIAYGSGIGSGFDDIEENQILRVITSLNTETVRVRGISGNQTSGAVTVAANSIVWEDNANFEILEDYPLRPRQPRFTSSTFYKDWDIPYADENLKPPPVVIAGPHRAKFLENGQAVFNVDLTDSYAIAKGASIASYGASVTPNIGVTINITNGIGTITFTQTGQYWVEFSATDTNGKTQKTKRRYWVHGAEADGDYPYTDLEITTLSGDWERGGWSLGITVHGTADTTLFPDEALVCLWHTVKYGVTTQYIGQPDGILFCGYIRRGTVRANWDDSTVSFEAETIQAVLRNISMQSVPLQAVRNPSKWYEYPIWLTNGRALHHYWRYHSTLLDVADIYGLADDDTVYRAAVVFQKGDMYSQAENIIRENGICAHSVCNRAGQMYVVRDIQLLDDADRAGKTVIAGIEPVDRKDDITLIDRAPLSAAMSYVEGIYFDGETATGICAKAPGQVPEDQGAGEIVKRQQTLADETHAKSLAGRLLAVANNPYPELRVNFNGIWAGTLDITGDEWWQITIDETETDRGLSWTGKKVVCRTVNDRLDPVNGIIESEAVFEPESTGPEGIIVPCIGLPEAPSPSPPKWTEPGGLNALIAFGSAYYRDDNDSDWATLQTDNYTGGAVDPWWRIKTGSNNPQDVIWWAAGNGVLYRFAGINGLPDNRMPTTDPPNTWSDAPAPAVSGLEFIGPFPDRWVKNQWYVLARAQINGLWRGWLAYTDDDGISWTWVELHDGVNIPTQLKPLWLAVNGNVVLVTIWKDGELCLIVCNAGIAYQTEYNLGDASASELEAQSRFAIPVTVLDDDNLWHIAGRMNSPTTLGGDQHIIKSTDGGSTWASVESGWGSDRCAALYVSAESGGNRDYYSVRVGGLVPSPSTYTYMSGITVPPIVSDGADIYALSGTTLYKFDGGTETVSTLPALPSGTLSTTAVISIGGNLYAGTYSSGSFERIYRLDAGPAWTLVHEILNGGATHTDSFSLSVVSGGVLKIKDGYAVHQVAPYTGTPVASFSSNLTSWTTLTMSGWPSDGSYTTYIYYWSPLRRSDKQVFNGDYMAARYSQSSPTSDVGTGKYNPAGSVSKSTAPELAVIDAAGYWHVESSQVTHSTALEGTYSVVGDGSIIPVESTNIGSRSVAYSVTSNPDSTRVIKLHWWDGSTWSAGETIDSALYSPVESAAGVQSVHRLDDGRMYVCVSAGDAYTTWHRWYKRDTNI